jgi:FKBP-type peptidyl-prolyl cis-trans isomerase (trigger factor)
VKEPDAMPRARSTIDTAQAIIDRVLDQLEDDLAPQYQPETPPAVIRERAEEAIEHVLLRLAREQLDIARPTDDADRDQ